MVAHLLAFSKTETVKLKPTIPVLKELCRKRGLPLTGTKKVLLERLSTPAVLQSISNFDIHASNLYVINACKSCGSSFAIVAHGRKQFDFPHGNLNDPSVRETIRSVVEMDDEQFERIFPKRQTKTLFSVTRVSPGRVIEQLVDIKEPRPFKTIKAFDCQSGQFLG
ncbi:hypothetical protein ScalyP_jg7531 [Parmales sp. scaly parma]|nr:hypothetical protein ScalyP_jg7531 [Parmales sp. scaly parma]